MSMFSKDGYVCLKLRENLDSNVQQTKEGSIEHSKLFPSLNRYIIISDVRYTSIYLNIYFIEYRDTILAFGYIDTLAWTA